MALVTKSDVQRLVEKYKFHITYIRYSVSLIFVMQPNKSHDPHLHNESVSDLSFIGDS